jgi:disulfide bond formation protein DsbB
MFKPLPDPRTMCLFAAVAAAAVLAGALFFQYVVGLAPCPLCILQRWPYAAVIALGAIGVFAPLAEGGQRAMLLLCAAGFATACGFGVYHAGVEYGWFAGPDGCTGIGVTGNSIEELRKQLIAAPVVRCDEVPWSLFGISLAGYNAIIAAGLTAATATTALKPARR